MANRSELGINPTPEEIHAELARVLASPVFVASRQLARFLQFVVDESLSGHEDRIKERTVAIRALGRDSTFDRRLDPIVRMVAGDYEEAWNVTT